MEPRGPESLSEIVARLFTARGWGRKQERLRLERAWEEAAGAEIAKETRVSSLRRGIFEIDVRGPVLFQELSQFHKRKLLEKLRGLLPGVKINDLRFRAGTWTNEGEAK